MGRRKFLRPIFICEARSDAEYPSRVEFVWRFDFELFRQIHVGWHNEALDKLFWLFSYSGLGQVEGIAILLLLFNKQWKGLVAPLMASLVVSGFVLADSIKLIIPRDRPSNLPWAIPQEQDFFHSFPSGHTTSAFGIAFMLLLLTRGTPRRHWGWIAMAWAALVGVSRVYRGVHWPTDVIGGAFLGLVGASICYLVFSRFGWLPESEPAAEEQP